MTPLVKGKAKQAWPVVLCCMVVIAILIAIKVFSPPGGSVEASQPIRAHLYLPSIAEVQQMIIDRGYKIKVDGMVCASCYAEGHSETQYNWDLAYNDQSARATWPQELAVKEAK